MSSRENQTAVPESQDDNYEATVLDFLDKEIAASQPVRNQNDQSAELDALVSDLLKQVITESDQPQQGQTAAPEDQEDAISETISEQEAASSSESNMLANLNRGLSQNLSEKDLWDGESVDSQASPDVGRPGGRPSGSCGTARIARCNSGRHPEDPHFPKPGG